MQKKKKKLYGKLSTWPDCINYGPTWSSVKEQCHYEWMNTGHLTLYLMIAIKWMSTNSVLFHTILDVKKKKEKKETTLVFDVKFALYTTLYS